MWTWAALGLLGLLAVVLAGQYRAARRVYRPLASRQPERQRREVPLGYEGLDMDEVSRTTRRNESLERGQTNWLSNKGFFGRPDTNVTPLADDETYAARYYDAFQKDKDDKK